MKNKDVLMSVLLFLFCASSASAKERYEFYTGVRQMGMGGATVAVVNDETALIHNPAALGKLRTKYLTLIDPEIHVGETSHQILKDKDYDITKTMDPQDLLGLLLSNPDKNFHQKVQLFPSFVLPNFGIGLLASYNYDARVDSATNTYHLRYRNDFAVLVGYNFRFYDGIIKLGFNGKYINRVEMDEALPDSSTGLDWKNLVNEGTAISSDIALMLTGPWQYLPTMAFVWRDVGNTKFSFGSGMFYSGRPDPETVEQTVDFGVSLSPILGKHSRMQLVGEYRDILTYDEEDDHQRRIHYGLEFNIFDRLFLRGGVNQRYWTAGIEIASLNMQFQAATYGEEIGEPGARREDRRYIFKFAMRF